MQVPGQKRRIWTIPYTGQPNNENGRRWLVTQWVMKKRSEGPKHCALAVVGGAKKFCPAADPLPGGA